MRWKLRVLDDYQQRTEITDGYEIFMKYALLLCFEELPSPLSLPLVHPWLINISYGCFYPLPARERKNSSTGCRHTEENPLTVTVTGMVTLTLEDQLNPSFNLHTMTRGFTNNAID